MINGVSITEDCTESYYLSTFVDRSMEALTIIHSIRTDAF